MDLNFSNEIYESIRHLEISLAFILFQEFFNLEREFVSITENPLNKGTVVFATVSFKGSISQHPFSQFIIDWGCS